MKRESDIARTIHAAYDMLLVNKPLCEINNENLMPGVYIDPILPNARAQKITDFIYGYKGNDNDSIISISDVYCQKLYVVCFLAAKLLIKAGTFRYSNEGVVQCTGDYNLSRVDLKQIIQECKVIIQNHVVDIPTTSKLRYSSTVVAGAVMLAWMIYMSIVAGVGALSVIGAVVGCAQIVIAVVAGMGETDASENIEKIQAMLPLLASRCVALGIGLGVLSLLPGGNIDSEKAIWLLGLAVVLLAITRIAETENHD